MTAAGRRRQSWFTARTTIMTRAKNNHSKRRKDQIAAAEKTLLALESLLAQTEEKIAITRKLIAELVAAQDGRPKSGTKRARKR
jgi:hypothetical protein